MNVSINNTKRATRNNIAWHKKKLMLTKAGQLRCRGKYKKYLKVFSLPDGRLKTFYFKLKQRIIICPADPLKDFL